MLISPAYAQSGGQSPDLLTSLLPFILIFVVFYFLLIRPQQKRAKQHREMVASLKRNDRVVTTGGLMGVVTKASDGSDAVEVEIAKGVQVEVLRAMIAEVRDRDGNPITVPTQEGRKPKKKQ